MDISQSTITKLALELMIRETRMLNFHASRLVNLFNFLPGFNFTVTVHEIIDEVLGFEPSHSAMIKSLPEASP